MIVSIVIICILTVIAIGIMAIGVSVSRTIERCEKYMEDEPLFDEENVEMPEKES